MTETRRMTSAFERYLTVWVGLCILAGIALGRLAPGVARTLDGYTIDIAGAPVVSIPIAVCLFFMMYPIMVKIDFGRVARASRNTKPVLLTLFINWAVKPFTMVGIAALFLGVVFRGLIGPEAVDLVKMPFGLDLPLGASHGAGTVVLADGGKMLEVPLWRSYLAGCILLGIAPCTAMVLVWGYLARGNDGLTLVMVALNSLTMLVLYGVLGGFLLGVGRLPVPWQALLLSIGVYVALPLVAGFFSRKWIIAAKGEAWFKEKFLHWLDRRADMRSFVFGITANRVGTMMNLVEEVAFQRLDCRLAGYLVQPGQRRRLEGCRCDLGVRRDGRRAEPDVDSRVVGGAVVPQQVLEYIDGNIRTFLDQLGQVLTNDSSSEVLVQQVI